MKKYLDPEMEIELFDGKDLITAASEYDDEWGKGNPWNIPDINDINGI